MAPSLLFTPTAADWVRSSSAEITREFHALDDIADLGFAALTHAPSCASHAANYAAVVVQCVALLTQSDALRPGTLLHLPIHASYLRSGLWLDATFLKTTTHACTPRPCGCLDPTWCVLAITTYTASRELCAHLFHIPTAAYELPSILAVGRRLVSVATAARRETRAKQPAAAAAAARAAAQ